MEELSIPRSPTIHRLLWIAVVCLVLGYAFRTFSADLPFRALLWDEGWLRPWVEGGGGTWADWVGAQGGGNQLVYWLQLVFVATLSWGLVSLLRAKQEKPPYRSMFVLSLFLGLIVLLQTKENFWRWGYFAEHALQIASPLVLAVYWRNGLTAGLHLGIRVLIALTFVGHGLYAVGFYPVPHHFLWMFSEGMAHAGAVLTEGAVRMALKIVGFLDFFSALLLLFPFRKLQLLGLLWIIPWALLTTMARWWSYADATTFLNLLIFWTPEVLLRFPHFLLPLACWGWPGGGLIYGRLRQGSCPKTD